MYKNILFAPLVFTLSFSSAHAKVQIPGCNVNTVIEKPALTAYDKLALAGAVVLNGPFIILGGIGTLYDKIAMPEENPDNTIRIAKKYLMNEKLSRGEFNYFLERADSYTNINMLQATVPDHLGVWAEPAATESYCGMMGRGTLPPNDCFCYSKGERALSMILGALAANGNQYVADRFEAAYKAECEPLMGNEREPCVQDLITHLLN